MSFIKKPRIDLPGQLSNEIGLLKRDYEGVLSTLCAGCGHDSITAAIVQAFWELSIATREGNQAFRYWLLFKNTGLFSIRSAWLQLGSWPYAIGGHWCTCR